MIDPIDPIQIPGIDSPFCAAYPFATTTKIDASQLHVAMFIAARRAHKKPYTRIAAELDKQIDLLIVVDQMLTGFDSRWVYTLHLDKLQKYENVIQAFPEPTAYSGQTNPT